LWTPPFVARYIGDFEVLVESGRSEREAVELRLFSVTIAGCERRGVHGYAASDEEED
jgi:hypothetical protein